MPTKRWPDKTNSNRALTCSMFTLELIHKNEQTNMHNSWFIAETDDCLPATEHHCMHSTHCVVHGVQCIQCMRELFSYKINGKHWLILSTHTNIHKLVCMLSGIQQWFVLTKRKIWIFCVATMVISYIIYG